MLIKDGKELHFFLLNSSHAEYSVLHPGSDFTGRPVNEGGAGDAEATTDLSNVKSKPGTGHSKTAQKILRAQKEQPAPTLFLGNLSFETTEKSIRELFVAHRSQSARQKGKVGGDKVEKEPHDIWIRKVRLGTFEDSGLCKGYVSACRRRRRLHLSFTFYTTSFAFVDFTNTENATNALINPRNHRLDGRSIIVEYASPDAVRRGGTGTQQPSAVKKVKKKTGPRGERLQRRAALARMRGEEHNDKIADAKKSALVRVKTEKVTKFQASRGKQERFRSRPKPGAALAQAKRESVAIIPSEGQKIKF